MDRDSIPLRRRNVLKSISTTTAATVVGLAGCLGGGGGDGGDAEYNWVCGTSGEETAVHATATAFSSVLSEHSDVVNMSPQTSGGTAANNPLIDQGEIDVGITTHSTLWEALQGRGAYDEPVETTLCQTFSYMTLDIYLARTDEKEELQDVETVSDIPDGTTVSFGPVGTSSVNTAYNACEVLGIDPDERWDMQPEELGDQVDALNEGRIDVAGLYSVNREAHGAGWQEELDSTAEVDVLEWEVTEEMAAESELPLLVATTPGDIWNQEIQHNEFTTLPIGYTTVIPAEMENEAVYEYTAVLLENHEQLRGMANQLSQHGPDMATEWLQPDDVPVHPGTQEYLEENDLWDDNLTTLDEYEG